MMSVLLDDVFLILVTFFNYYSAFFLEVLHLQANPGVASDTPFAISLDTVPELLDSSIRGVVAMAYT
jgi:hypothetical protein